MLNLPQRPYRTRMEGRLQKSGLGLLIAAMFDEPPMSPTTICQKFLNATYTNYRSILSWYSSTQNYLTDHSLSPSGYYFFVKRAYLKYRDWGGRVIYKFYNTISRPLQICIFWSIRIRSREWVSIMSRVRRWQRRRGSLFGIVATDKLRLFTFLILMDFGTRILVFSMF